MVGVRVRVRVGVRSMVRIDSVHESACQPHRCPKSKAEATDKAEDKAKG